MQIILYNYMFSLRTVQRISVNRRILGSGCRRCGAREWATTFCLAILTSFALNQPLYVYLKLRYNKKKENDPLTPDLT